MDTQQQAVLASATQVIKSGRLFAGSCFSLISTAVAFSIVTSLVMQLKDTFGLNNAQAGWILGASIWGFTISIFVLGPLCDALGMRRLMRLAFVFHFAGVLLMIFARNYEMLFGGALILSMGNGIVEAVCNPLIATIYPDRKTMMLNRFHVWFPGGIVIGGLIAFGIDKLMAGSVAIGSVHLAAWQIKLAVVLVPTIIYGILFAGQKFPATERVASGISFGGMVKATLLRPLFIILFFCMMLTASIELGPGRWMAQAMEEAMAGILVCSAVLAGVGLYSLTLAQGPLAIVAAATIFACGVCYFWPTMLGVAAERVPKGGALALGLLGGTGMAVVGLVAVPLMGIIADRHVNATLQADQVKACLVQIAHAYPQLADLASSDENRQAIRGTIEKVTEVLESDFSMKEANAAMRLAIMSIPDSGPAKRAQEILAPADTQGNLVSFRWISSASVVLVLVFGICTFEIGDAAAIKSKRSKQNNSPA